MEKPALADHPINETMKRRWSPRAFTPRPMPREDILTILEAARWAASSFNQQPWHFLVATRDEEERFAQLLDCLVPGNQVWARNASLLIVTVTKRTFDHNDSPNSCCVHDIGLTACQLVLQATEMGYATHQMAGIEPEKIRETYGVPEGFDPVTESPSAIPVTRTAFPTTSGRWNSRPVRGARSTSSSSPTAGASPPATDRRCPRVSATPERRSPNVSGSEGCPTSM